MEVNKSTRNDSLISAPGNTNLLPEIGEQIHERRVAKSARKSSEPAGEDIDDDVGDADEIAVETAAEETLEKIDGILKNPVTPKAVAAVIQKNGKIDEDDAEELLATVNEHDVTDLEVQAVETGEKTTVEASNGRKKVIVLDDGEKSRKVEIGGETVLVIDNDLSEEEVIDETEKQVIDTIETLLAKDYGLDERYDPLFNALNAEGFDSFARYLGNYAIPKATQRITYKIFEKNDQADQLFDQMIVERQSYDRMRKG